MLYSMFNDMRPKIFTGQLNFNHRCCSLYNPEEEEEEEEEEE